MAKAAKTRTERDTMGEVAVPGDRYWGAQTQRSLANFDIGTEKTPAPLIRAFGIQKLAAARANMALGALAPRSASPLPPPRPRSPPARWRTIFPWRCGRPARAPRRT